MFHFLGESKRIKKGKKPVVGKPLRDPNVPSNKAGKKLSKQKTNTDAKVSDYEGSELSGMKNIQKHKGK